MSAPTAKTTGQRQQDLRERRAAEGLAEVRGIYLPPALHPEVKRLAKKIAKSNSKLQNSDSKNQNGLQR